MAPLSDSLIQELQSLLPDLEIITPSSPKYERAYQRWMGSAEKRAGAITYPTTSSTISRILQFTSTHHIPLAVCGGGHSFRGSSVTDGLVISLSNLTSITVNPGDGTPHATSDAIPTVTASGGALWSSIYAAASKHNLALVGGVSPSVGVGGFTLHGGYGWLTGAHGVALDSLLEAEIVLADGRILTCSEKENEELFWAIRGAGACFGVVTRFTLKAYGLQGRVWGGVLALRRGALGTLVRVGNRVMAEENEGGRAAMCVVFGQLPAVGGDGEREVGIMCIVFYNGNEDDARAFFAPLLEAKPLVDTTKMVEFKDSGMESGSAVGNQWRKATAGGSVIAPLEERFLGELFMQLEDLVAKCRDAERSIVGFEFHNPYAAMRVGNKGTAFADRGNHGNVLVVPTWSKEENDGVCVEWCRKLGRTVDEEFERRKKDEGMDEVTRASTGIYPNYNGLGKGPKILFGANYERLVELKKKYDPGNVFKEFIDLLEDE